MSTQPGADGGNKQPFAVAIILSTLPLTLFNSCMCTVEIGCRITNARERVGPAPLRDPHDRDQPLVRARTGLGPDRGLRLQHTRAHVSARCPPARFPRALLVLPAHRRLLLQLAQPGQRPQQPHSEVHTNSACSKQEAHTVCTSQAKCKAKRCLRPPHKLIWSCRATRRHMYPVAACTARCDAPRP